MSGGRCGVRMLHRSIVHSSGTSDERPTMTTIIPCELNQLHLKVSRRKDSTHKNELHTWKPVIGELLQIPNQESSHTHDIVD